MRQKFRSPSCARPDQGFSFSKPTARSRPLLALALAFGLSLGLFPPPGVSAQTEEPDAPAPKGVAKWVADPHAGVYVVYQSENGDTACRVATPDEARRLRRPGGGVELQQINHLEEAGAGGLAPGSESSAEGPSSAVNAANMTIILRATTQLQNNPAARDAFVRAAAKWEALLADPVVVIIDVDFGPNAFGEPFPGSNTLGVTGGQALFFNNNYTDVRNRLISHATNAEESAIYNALPTGSLPTDLGTTQTITVESALLRALGAINPVANPDTETNFGPPPRIAFNSAFNFDLDPSNGITSNQTDFDAVAVHEIGHALGFDSNVGVRELQPSEPLRAALWDLFRLRPGAGPSGGFSTAQRVLSTGGEQVHYDGGPELRLSTGNPEGNNGDGEQASHWKDDALNGGVFIGIMDPSIPRGRREELTANDIRTINTFGYSVGSLPPPPPPPGNDNFAAAQVLSGFAGAAAGTNVGATEEAGEPNHEPGNNIGGKSVWYRWTAPATGTATFDTLGSTYDTLLAAYTGSSVGALTRLASQDDISPISAPPPRNIRSRIQFAAQAGTTYFIAVDGFNDTSAPANAAQGSIVLNFSLAAGPDGSNVVSTQPSVVVSEGGANFVDIAVTRSGSTGVGAKVDYATSDGTASSRTDYLPAFGTLVFSPGETSKSVRVFVTDDALVEGRENLTLSLTNPAGCTLGTATTDISLDSNDATPGLNPVRTTTNGVPSFSPDFFVRQQYRDFLNREADAPGLAFWTGQLTSCGSDAACLEARKENVSAAFFLSIEFQQTGYLVYRTHQAAFDTGPNLQLLTFLSDTQRVGQGVIIGQPGANELLEANRAAYFAEFVMRPAFLARYPETLTPTQFVDALNQTTGGSLSQTERETFISDLATGFRSRAQVLRAVAEDTDFNAREKNRAFVLEQYFGYLRRNPNEAPEPTLDFQGYNFWLGKLNQFGGNFVQAEMVKAFTVSEEYKLRFGP